MTTTKGGGFKVYNKLNQHKHSCKLKVFAHKIGNVKKKSIFVIRIINCIIRIKFLKYDVLQEYKCWKIQLPN